MDIWILRCGILLIAFFKSSNSTVSLSDENCPVSCTCKKAACPEEFLINCENFPQTWSVVHCANVSNGIISQMPLQVNSLSIETPINGHYFENILMQEFPQLYSLSISFTEDVTLNSSVPIGANIFHLNISNGMLKSFPQFVANFTRLQVLNLSSNVLEEVTDLSFSLPNLQVLDLSRNSLRKVSLRGGFDRLRELNLQNNQLKYLPKLLDLPHLEVLDISSNKLLFHDFYASQEEVEIARRNCAIFLPNSLESLILRENSLEKIPSEDCSLLAGLPMLKHLDVGNNMLRSVSSEDFPAVSLRTLLSLKLDKNGISLLASNAFDGFSHLNSLTLSNNQIRSVPFEIFEYAEKQMVRFSNNDLPNQYFIKAEGNPMSCDCTQEKVRQFLKNENQTVISSNDLECSYPFWLYGTKMADLGPKHLECYETTLRRMRNVTCHEYANCNISCIFDGLPHPQAYWISPAGQVISVEMYAKDPSLRDKFDLSSDGHKLVIKDLRLEGTGTYKCIGNNGFKNITGYVRVGVILEPIGSILAIVLSAVSFLIAIVLNSVNLCHYYCQHLREKRAKREAEAMPFKMESPIKSKQKGLHESEASLNANKYYKKYDFTCQQVFLDTVIKGAHTVKRTLYDARNSEFSNNVWEYASHLRDRLHIELPSSMQLPRVSMPSISMPTISMPNITMPSMPKFQSINTNIEKLGTSMMNRSHNLATSVGSVFNLRWLRSGNSDNESDSDVDVESGGVSQVQVDVHKDQDESPSQGQQSSTENSPGSHPKVPKYLGSSWLRRKTSKHMQQRSQDDTAVPRRTKSVRFAEADRPAPSVANLQRSASFSNIPSVSATVDVGQEQNDEVISVVCVDVPETYQFETTV